MKKFIITTFGLLSVLFVPFFAHAASLSNLNHDVVNGYANGGWLWNQTFTGFDGYINETSFLTDVSVQDEVTDFGTCLNSGIYDITGGFAGAGLVLSCNSIVKNSVTGEWRFNWTGNPYHFSASNTYMFYISNANSYDVNYFLSTIGDTFYGGQVYAALGTGNVFPFCSFTSPVWHCDNASQPADMYFVTEQFSSLTFNDIFGSVYHPTSTDGFAGLTPESCTPGLNFDSFGCYLGNTGKSLFRVLFIPTSGLNFLMDVFGQMKQVFPFNVFFSVADSMQSEVGSYASSSLGTSLMVKFPGHATDTISVVPSGGLFSSIFSGSFQILIFNWILLFSGLAAIGLIIRQVITLKH